MFGLLHSQSRGWFIHQDTFAGQANARAMAVAAPSEALNIVTCLFPAAELVVGSKLAVATKETGALARLT